MPETQIPKEEMETTKGEELSEEAQAANVAEFMDATGMPFKQNEAEETIEAAADIVEEELKQEAVEVPPTEPISAQTEEVEGETATEEETPPSAEATIAATEEESETVTPPEPSELELLREQNARLMAMMNDPSNADGLIARLAAAPAEQQVEPVAAAPVVAPLPSAPAPAVLAAIPAPLSAEAMESLLSDPKVLVEHISAEVQRGRQEILSEVPGIINNVLAVERRVSAYFARDENRDLLPLAGVVRQAAVNIERQKPGLSIEDLLEESAKITRESAGLNANLANAEVLPNGTVKIPKKPTGGVPSAAKRFARGTARRAPVTSTKPKNAPEPGSVEEQIQELYATTQ